MQVADAIAGALTAPDAVAWLAEELEPQARRLTLMTDADPRCWPPAQDLVDLVNTARGRFGALPVRLIGGVFRTSVIAETLRQRCGATVACTRPEVAAARLAAEAPTIGHPPPCATPVSPG